MTFIQSSSHILAMLSLAAFGLSWRLFIFSLCYFSQLSHLPWLVSCFCFVHSVCHFYFPVSYVAVIWCFTPPVLMLCVPLMCYFLLTLNHVILYVDWSIEIWYGSLLLMAPLLFWFVCFFDNPFWCFDLFRYSLKGDFETIS